MVVSGLNHLTYQFYENLSENQEEISTSRQILRGQNGTSEASVNVEFSYTTDKNGIKTILQNIVKVYTDIDDVFSFLDKYYENKEFNLTVNPSIKIKNNYIIFEAKGTYIIGNIKIGGIGFEYNPVIHTFTGVIDINNANQSFAKYNAIGKGAGRLYK
jgi:hypothetical protein